MAVSVSRLTSGLSFEESWRKLVIAKQQCAETSDKLMLVEKKATNGNLQDERDNG